MKLDKRIRNISNTLSTTMASISCMTNSSRNWHVSALRQHHGTPQTHRPKRLQKKVSTVSSYRNRSKSSSLTHSLISFYPISPPCGCYTRNHGPIMSCCFPNHLLYKSS